MKQAANHDVGSAIRNQEAAGIVMKKPLAGRRAFEARGRRAQSQGIPCLSIHAIGRDWPHWAREAWISGHVLNAPFRNIDIGIRSAAKTRVKRVTPGASPRVAATGAVRSSTAF